MKLDRGIIHDDLKPGNVLMDEFGHFCFSKLLATPDPAESMELLPASREPEPTDICHRNVSSSMKRYELVTRWTPGRLESSASKYFLERFVRIIILDGEDSRLTHFEALDVPIHLY
jgi:serine/threonine protein kinase